MNDGRQPAGLAADEFAGGYVWLQPGFGDFMTAGEVVNEDTPDGRAGMFTFAILNDHGASVTGLLGWSARLDAADHTGRCVFTLQMKG
ncbi:MAG: hypothetical protein ACXWXR_10735 [Candidatus Limnocylindrales bacterium]